VTECLFHENFDEDTGNEGQFRRFRNEALSYAYNACDRGLLLQSYISSNGSTISQETHRLLRIGPSRSGETSFLAYPEHFFRTSTLKVPVNIVVSTIIYLPRFNIERTPMANARFHVITLVIIRK